MMTLKGSLLINSQMLCLSPQYHLLELRGTAVRHLRFASTGRDHKAHRVIGSRKEGKGESKIISVITVCSSDFQQWEERVRVKGVV